MLQPDLKFSQNPSPASTEVGFASLSVAPVNGSEQIPTLSLLEGSRRDRPESRVLGSWEQGLGRCSDEDTRELGPP